MREEIIGYFLMFVGVVIMLVTIVQIYGVFTQKVAPFQVFDQPVTTSVATPSREQAMADPSSLAKMQSDLITQVLQKEMGKSMNLAATLFFYFFIMTFGYRLATLGVQLVRPIKVAVRGKNIVIDPEETAKLQQS